MTKDKGCGNFVEEYFIGNSRIRICDDYCKDVTEQDIEKILNRIASRVAIQLASMETAKNIEYKSSS